MNNVDDGIEIWGGTVDSSMFPFGMLVMTHLMLIKDGEVVQFGLIVQGYSRNASQGSGLGDNIFEFDGAENSDAQQELVQQSIILQQLRTPSLVMAQPLGETTHRFNSRNNIFIGKGDKLVRADGDDGDGSSGYGHNGTLTLAERFETDAVGSDGIAHIDCKRWCFVYDGQPVSSTNRW